MKLEQILKDYPSFIKGTRDGSAGTVKDYLHDLNRYLEFFQKKVNPDLGAFDINASLVRNYVIFLREHGNSTSTVERRLHSLKAFWKYLHFEHGYPPPPHNIKDIGIRIKKTRNPTRPIDDENYLLLMEKLKDELSKIN